MPNCSYELAKTIRKALDSQRIDPEDLASAVGSTASYISHLFSEKQEEKWKHWNPTLESLEAIAGVLGVEPWKLLRPEGAE